MLGVPCVGSLAEIDEPIDLVDVFRRAEQHARSIAREAVAVGAEALWLQLGVVSPDARQIATERRARLRRGRVHGRRAPRLSVNAA